ncbi:MAG: hypothetical protein DLM69_01220 [Candidatus Chloroheliales bacterium]|nr:MAG: hypothetical protein DLM69_01220 [Chloroflexota bacterium]
MLIEDYRGPLNASVIGSTLATLPPNVGLAPMRWLDEPPGEAIAAPRIAGDSSLSSDFDVFSAYASSDQVSDWAAMCAVVPVVSAGAYTSSDQVSDWAGGSMLWSLATFPAMLLGGLLVFILSFLLGSMLPAVLVKWVVALPAFIPIALSIIEGARAIINLRRSDHSGQTLFIATIGLTIAVLFLLFILDFLNHDFGD